MEERAVNILLVEDEESLHETLKLNLELENYQVTSAYDGNEAIKAVKNEYFDLIILDVLLSGIDGRDLCKSLKNDPMTKHIPLIMISAHPNAEKSIKKVKADDYLKKPFEMDELLRKVAKYL